VIVHQIVVVYPSRAGVPPLVAPETGLLIPSGFVNYRPELASEEEYVSKKSSTHKLPNSFNRDGENVGPPLKLDEKWPQNMHTLNRR
jgi:hypothetical protein